MKKLLVIGAAFTLASCSALLPVAISGVVDAVTPAKSVGDTVVLEGKRALVLAHNAYQGTAMIAYQLIEADKLPPSRVDQIEAANAKILVLLDDAETHLSDAERAVAVLNATSELAALVPSGAKIDTTPREGHN
jgi:hypothetical protein